MPRHYLDTYAMIEYLRGSSRYLKVISETETVTCLMNLIELYYLILRDHSKDMAERAFLAFRQSEVPIKDEDIKSGMALRLKARARKIDLSYADAIGYSISERMGTRYLTGDSAFRDFPHVEFLR
jgi:predicted nucleic acid-binding protein